MELEKTTFEDLPDEIVLLLTFLLSDLEVAGLCLINKHYNEVFSTAEWLWKKRLVKIFPSPIFVRSWKNSYRELGVWMLGENYEDQLGINMEEQYATKFTRVPKIRAISMAMCSSYSCFLDLDNRMLGCGSNYAGQLGVYTPIGELTFEFGEDIKINKVPNLKVLSISTHRDCTFIIDDKNRLWMCGHNPIGFKNATKRLSIISDIKARNISFRYDHAIMIDMEYNVWVCGKNNFCRLGVGDICDRCQFVKIPNFKAKIGYAGHSSSVFIDLEDQPWICGSVNDDRGSMVPVLIPGIKVISACIDIEILFIDEDHNLVQYRGRKGNLPILLKVFGEKVLSISTIMNDFTRLIIDYDNNVWIKNCSSNVITRVPNILGYAVVAGDVHCGIIGVGNDL